MITQSCSSFTDMIGWTMVGVMWGMFLTAAFVILIKHSSK